MNFQELNTKRRSIRNFTNKKVSDDLIHEILKEALEAPSSSNTQPFKAVVATGETLKEIGEELTNKYKQSLILSKKIFLENSIGLTNIIYNQIKSTKRFKGNIQEFIKKEG